MSGHSEPDYQREDAREEVLQFDAYPNGWGDEHKIGKLFAPFDKDPLMDTAETKKWWREGFGNFAKHIKDNPLYGTHRLSFSLNEIKQTYTWRDGQTVIQPCGLKELAKEFAKDKDLLWADDYVKENSWGQWMKSFVWRNKEDFSEMDRITWGNIIESFSQEVYDALSSTQFEPSHRVMFVDEFKMKIEEFLESGLEVTDFDLIVHEMKKKEQIVTFPVKNEVHVSEEKAVKFTTALDKEATEKDRAILTLTTRMCQIQKQISVNEEKAKKKKIEALKFRRRGDRQKMTVIAYRTAKQFDAIVDGNYKKLENMQKLIDTLNSNTDESIASMRAVRQALSGEENDPEQVEQLADDVAEGVDRNDEVNEALAQQSSGEQDEEELLKELDALDDDSNDLEQQERELNELPDVPQRLPHVDDSSEEDREQELKNVNAVMLG